MDHCKNWRWGFVIVRIWRGLSKVSEIHEAKIANQMAIWRLKMEEQHHWRIGFNWSFSKRLIIQYHVIITEFSTRKVISLGYFHYFGWIESESKSKSPLSLDWRYFYNCPWDSDEETTSWKVDEDRGIQFKVCRQNFPVFPRPEVQTCPDLSIPDPEEPVIYRQVGPSTMHKIMDLIYNNPYQ